MLTFFKPWRNVNDLVNDCENVTDAFKNHPFTKAEEEKMGFFNVRYECSDARDEYSQILQRKKQTNAFGKSDPDDAVTSSSDLDDEMTFIGNLMPSEGENVNDFLYTEPLQLKETDEIADKAG